MKYRTGIITEKQFVNYFASDKQKTKYDKYEHFTGTMKQSILRQANTECCIEEIGSRKYKITKIYKNKLPDFMPKLHEGLYQYIIPLVLTKLINNRDEYKKVSFTFYKWARLIEMVNHNYWPMKKNIKYSNQLNIDSKIFVEYFDRVDDSLQYYIQRSLEYLNKAGVIEWFKVPMVCKRKVSVEDNQAQKHKINIDVQYENVIATPEETKFSLECMDKVMKKLKIKSKSECFFGQHAQEFANEFNKELKEHDIEYFYTTYQAYCIDSNIDKCKNILDTYCISDNEKFIKEFNLAFKNNIVTLAEKRYNKVPDAFNDNYIDYFKQLTDITIDKDATKLSYLAKDNSDNIKDLLSSNIDLAVNGTKIDLDKIGDSDN